MYDEAFWFMFHRTVSVAKGSDRRGIILNYDDMQMGRKEFPLTLPVMKQYPYEPPDEVKEEMPAYGFTDFWQYFYNVDKIKKQRQEEERKSKKKRWFFR